MVHDLKILPEYYVSILSGEKRFEVRRNDRDFNVGDFLYLREYDKSTSSYTGRGILCIVTYILRDDVDFVKVGYCIMSIDVI